MVDIIIDATLAMGTDLLLVGALGITVSVGIVALVVGWKFITKMIL